MAKLTSTPTLTLHDGVQIPQLGFGVFQVPPEETRSAVETAFEARLSPHRHRRRVSQRGGWGRRSAPAGARAATRSSSPPSCGTTARATTRPWRRSSAACERLGLEHVDLYLIHWPAPAQDRYFETWRAFEQIHADGRRPLDRRLQLPRRWISSASSARSSLLPTVNQIELHPNLAAGRAARLARRPRHRHRGLEPARPGRACSTTPRSKRSPRHHERTPAQIDPALAPAARQRRDPQIGHAGTDPRELRASSTSSSARTTSP